MKKSIIALFLAGTLAFAGSTFAQAASPEEGIREAGDAAASAAEAAFDNAAYEAERSRAETEKNAAEARLEEAEASLRVLEERQRQLAGEIDEKNAELVDLLVRISETNAEVEEAVGKVEASEKTIAATELKLGDAEEALEIQYEAMKRRIQYFYENAYPLGIFGTLLNGGSGTPLDRMEQLLSLEEADRDAYQAYRRTVQGILLLKEKLGEEKKVLLSEKRTLETRQAALDAEETELSREIETLRQADGDYEHRIETAKTQAASISELIREKNDRLSEIAAAEDAARSAAVEAARKNAEEAARKRAAEEAARKAEAERKAAEEAARKAAEENARKKREAMEAARKAKEEAEAAERRAAEKRAADEALAALEGKTAAAAAIPIEAPPTPTPAVLSGEALGRKIVEYADQFIGCPYVWGGNSLTNGCDCSHFVHLVLLHCGAYSGGYMTSGYWPYAGLPVNSLAEARAGDIICYSGHVGIYDGAGLIVEARGSAYGIVHNRPATCKPIVAIRRFT